MSKNAEDVDAKKALLVIRSQMIAKTKVLQEAPATKILKAQKVVFQSKITSLLLNRDKLKSSAVYRFDTCLKKVGCDRNAFHKSNIDGNKGRQLMQRREEFGILLFEEMKLCLEEARESRKA